MAAWQTNYGYDVKNGTNLSPEAITGPPSKSFTVLPDAMAPYPITITNTIANNARDIWI